jgi:putative oxidoreductase
VSKSRNIATWVITVIMTAVFVAAGFAKVSGDETMVEAFTTMGLPGWFRIAIGSLELLGGVSLLVPALTGTSAFGLSIIMIGAVSCHVMFTPMSQALPALVILALLTYIYLTRKNVVPSFLQNLLVG